MQEAVEQRRAAAAMEEQARAEAAEAKLAAKREAAVSYVPSAAAADLLRRVCAACGLTFFADDNLSCLCLSLQSLSSVTAPESGAG